MGVNHPKLEKVQSLLLEHFKKHKEDLERGTIEPGSQTRAIIFAEFRDTINQIVDTLQAYDDWIKAEAFIGHASTKKGKGGKGLTQKEQLAIIDRFRNGDVNTLVATSIGEEGLDVGEVDLIICFDVQVSSRFYKYFLFPSYKLLVQVII